MKKESYSACSDSAGEDVDGRANDCRNGLRGDGTNATLLTTDALDVSVLHGR